MSKKLVTKDKEVDSDQVVAATFKPRARLLLQLGDQLIKNESIALVELVKNSYDADAGEVAIEMSHVDDTENGLILIEDDGFGMDLNTVVNVWLEPGSDFKSEQIAALRVTPKFGRLPIGEKGIGRFGVHKLGDVIRMTTKKSRNKEVYVHINWGDFGKYKYLDQVPITIVERVTPHHFSGKKTGTKIEISGLREPWEKSTARNVKRSITALISPFETNDSFNVSFEILDKPGWFEGLLAWEDIEKFALFSFQIRIAGDSIRHFEYSFLPWPTMEKLSGRRVGIYDSLVQTFRELRDDDGRPISLADFNIGEVRFEGYIFDQDTFVMKLGVSDKQGFKGYLKNNGGVRVFRDGLRVFDYGEPENDWLALDYRRFLQPTKRISNNLILGAIHLNRKESGALIEKTNREGFVENPPYDTFRQSILHCLNIVETLRFSDKQRLREAYGPTRKSEPVLQILGELKSFVDRKVREEEVRIEIARYLVKIESDYQRINENLLKAAGAGLSMSVVLHEVEKIIFEIKKVVRSEKSSQRVLHLVTHLSELIDGYSEIISRSSQRSLDIKEVLNQSLFNTEFRLSAHKIQVIKAYLNRGRLPSIKTARNLLIGSLMNIFDNSIFWLEKAKSLNSKLKKKIYIDAFATNGFVSVLIADNGTGFLLPTAEIVEPFVSAKPDGMGLGLHIVNEVMLAQGGKLDFPDWSDLELPRDFRNGAITELRLKTR